MAAGVVMRIGIECRRCGVLGGRDEVTVAGLGCWAFSDVDKFAVNDVVDDADEAGSFMDWALRTATMGFLSTGAFC